MILYVQSGTSVCCDDEFAHTARFFINLSLVLVEDGKHDNTNVYPDLGCRYQQVLAD